METTTAGVTIQAPQLDINTVAAGGGSRLFFANGIFVVGPESVGAHPGPVCYRKGGHLSITDANLVLGRILPEYFPKIFGPNCDESLDRCVLCWFHCLYEPSSLSEASYSAMKELTSEINDYVKNNPDAFQKEYSVEELQSLGIQRVFIHKYSSLLSAYGIALAKVVNEAQEPANLVFSEGIQRVFIHKYSSLLSAYGIALAKVVNEAQEPANLVFSEETMPIIAERFAALSEKAIGELKGQGFVQVDCERFLHMRFARTDCAIMIAADYDSKHPDSLMNFVEAFNSTYKREFGFILEGRDIIIDDIRVRALASSGSEHKETIAAAEDPEHPKPVGSSQTFFEGGFLETAVYDKKNLLGGHIIHGPAMILDKNSTIVVEPLCTAKITHKGDILLEVCSKREEAASLQVIYTLLFTTTVSPQIYIIEWYGGYQDLSKFSEHAAEAILTYKFSLRLTASEQILEISCFTLNKQLYLLFFLTIAYCSCSFSDLIKTIIVIFSKPIWSKK
ncbi:unnamed protein product [Strongylus vulgaris]|uniref:Uncharacterized protein n=1 Tax=Strongylus vulgaris TaxID=40348 RepID=A0A3P7J841_STRVU|nr:unnamed protein product [Strongylus vulgaris]